MFPNQRTFSNHSCEDIVSRVILGGFNKGKSNLYTCTCSGTLKTSKLHNIFQTKKWLPTNQDYSTVSDSISAVNVHADRI